MHIKLVSMNQIQDFGFSTFNDNSFWWISNCVCKVCILYDVKIYMQTFLHAKNVNFLLLVLYLSPWRWLASLRTQKFEKGLSIRWQFSSDEVDPVNESETLQRFFNCFFAQIKVHEANMCLPVWWKLLKMSEISHIR